MKRNLLVPYALLLTIFLTGVSLPVSADDYTQGCSIDVACAAGTNASFGMNQTSNSSDSGICIYFFYSDTCPHCANVEPMLKDLAAKYPDVNVKYFQVSRDQQNTDLLNNFFMRYEINAKYVPAVFIGDRAFIGEGPIKDNLESSIQYFEKNKPICPLNYSKVEGNVHDVNPIEPIKLTLPILVAAAALDSINPCAFAVLIFLLSYLIALGARSRILKVGTTYIVMVYIVYFISGLGLLTVIQTTNLAVAVRDVVAVISIFIGLINVKEFFWEGKGIKLAIPESQKPRIERYIHKASVPAALVLGVLVAMVELPCTGGPYLGILAMISNEMTRNQAIPYLLLYNVIFVLPLFIIMGFVYLGVPTEKVEKVRVLSKGWARLAMGAFLVLFGIAMLLNWI